MKPSEFLAALWTDTPPGLPHLWLLEGRKSFYLHNCAAADVIAASHPADLYVGVSIAHQDHGPRQRTTNRQAAGIPGFWLDIDVNGGPDNKTGAASSEDEAFELAQAILEPTLVVHSGYGMHAWWLFADGPWRFSSVEEQHEAATAVAQWQQLHRDVAGFTVDATHDLARLLRIPGTVNAKGGGKAAVRAVIANGPRSSRAALLKRAAAAGPIALGTAADVDVQPGVPDRVDIAGLLQSSREFAATWAHERADHPHWSWSEYDLALCSIAVKAGWTDQQLADLIAAHGARHANSKGQRADYVARTIARARTGIDETQQPPSPAGQTEGATYDPDRWAQHIRDRLAAQDDDAIPLPFTELTEALDGGLRPGEICLVAGYTSSGKSVLVDQIADTAAAAGRRVHIYMTEMTAYRRGLRLLARQARVSFRRLKRRELTDEDHQAIEQVLAELPYGCSVVSDWTVEQTVDHIRENQWDLAVIDLIHGFHYADERELSKTSSVLTRATKGSSTGDHPGTAIVTAAHLNDGQMRDQRSSVKPRPGLHSIKGSSSLKQDADVVMFVWQQDDDEGRPTGEGAVWIAKARDGDTAGLNVWLDTGWMRFVPAIEPVEQVARVQDGWQR